MKTRLAPAVTGLALLIAACGIPVQDAAPLSHLPTTAPVSMPPANGSAAASAATTAPPPVIPGFEGWSVIKPFSVDIAADAGSLVLTLTHQALWFDADRGVLVSKLVEGDFRITAMVRTAKTSDLAKLPGGDGTVQLAGLMARADATPEDYVFIAVGDDGDGPSVETNSTDDSVSVYRGPLWTSGAADLRLCRVGAAFSLYKRLPGSSDAWSLDTTYQRPDLPKILQVGANIYSGSAPDITARFDGLRIDVPRNALDCSA